MHTSLTVQDIYIYPIKSLGAIRLSEALVEEKGFQYDRRWMLVDDEGVFLNQRNYPLMALLAVKLGAEGLYVYHKLNPDNRIQVPLNQAMGEELVVKIWDDEVVARKVHTDLDDWFSEFMGFRVSLVTMPDTTRRPVDGRYAVHSEAVSFADAMPYLIIGQASLDDLNSRLDHSVPMVRFRPNIVFSGGDAYSEDSLRKMRIGTVDFQIVKPCARCVMTTVDQESGIKGKEPLRTLATYRTINNKIYFGQDAVALQAGIIRVGDTIHTIA
jgi:uncharacterized protein YcbX